MKSLPVCRRNLRSLSYLTKLQEIINANTPFHRNFLDLLRKIFVYDPNQRITAKQALQHPFFKEVASPDDGTEALRIRLEREKRQQEKDDEMEDINMRRKGLIPGYRPTWK